jgi:hypothetical protein
MQVFKIIIKANGETIYEEITNMFNFTLRDTTLNYCNIYMKDYPNYYIFVDQEQAFCKWYRMMENDEHAYLQLNILK